MDFRTIVVYALTATLAGCAATRPAPVIDRSHAVKDERADTYIVKRYDTLYSIALEHGVDWKEMATWNGINDPTRLAVGQVLRVKPPQAPVYTSNDGGVQVNPVVTKPVVEARPIESAPIAATPAPAAATPPRSEPPAPSSSPPAAAGDLQFNWPSAGQLTAKFTEGGSKGVQFTGKVGDPVLASAPGKVTYVGDGVRGYGNLIIVKHNDEFLSVYAHNRKILVQGGQMVGKGQKIAEMGNGAGNQPLLHFEIRRYGKPVDPLQFLPARAD